MKNGMIERNSRRQSGARRLSRAAAIAAQAASMLGGIALLAANAAAQSPTPDQAVRIYNRIAGVPPSATTLAQMTSAPDPVTAALIATNDPAFYNDTIRNLAAPWTNRSQSVFVPLDDYIATVVGMVRDNVPFNTLLSADLVYIASPAASSANNLPAYSYSNNNLYAQMDANSVDLSTALVSSTQSAITGLPAAATAGIITTYGASSAFFVNGTNRAMFRFTMMNHLCNDLPSIMDTTRPPDRIRQDVTRSPGGVSTLFLTNCIGCHSGMDPMAQAFSYYNFDVATNTTLYTPGVTQAKYHINATNFPLGFNTPDDSWTNRWRAGPNMIMGWNASLPGSGNGAKSLGTELENSAQFTNCQVTRVFQDVCFRSPSNTADFNQVTSMIASFQSNNYSLRQVFAEAAAYCMGN
ncbi:MAG: hypothetical protein ABSF94_08635 [Steroidobacteraceae bacterium]|jgi:hypothetical protein